ncbi:hypothetical protein FQN57_005213 [Myotisia sp. PD_48]|nr:hypothetical protein FQN57_005213 [Myotisia sp. PD_48]
MGLFWVDWELWEKMCFVLGLLIALVLVYGTCVQIYNTWRIKRIVAAEALRRADPEYGAESEEFKEDDIPFGARALESGIEIEGIWVSNRNTPAPSPLQLATPLSTRPPTPESEKPPRLNASTAYATAVSEPPATTSDSKNRISIDVTSSTRDSSPGARVLEVRILKHDRSGSDIANQARIETVDLSTFNLPLTNDTDSRTVSRTETNGSAKRLRSLLLGKNKTAKDFKTIDGPGDLQALHSHRQCHIAETGQLGGHSRSLEASRA